MDEHILEEIGFTRAEKIVYLTLLEVGSSNAAPILEKSGLQNSVFYRTIHTLIKKGFVSYIKKGLIKKYHATNPHLLLTYLDERRERLQLFMPELMAKQTKQERQEAEVYVGIHGIRTMFYSLIEPSKKNDEYCFFAGKKEIYDETYEKLYAQLDKRRTQKQLCVKGIFDISLKQKIKKRSIQSRFVPFPLPGNMGIFNDKVAIVSWSEKPIGILITSKDIAEQYRKFFYEIWKLAEA